MQGKKKWLRMVVALLFTVVLMLGMTVTAFAVDRTVTLDYNGGKDDSGNSSSKITFLDTLHTAKAHRDYYCKDSAPIPKKTGYTFNGFFTATSGGKKFFNSDGSSVYKKTTDATDNCTRDFFTITQYAQWTANSYTVTLNNNGGTGGTTSVTATYDSAMPTATMPTRTGYTFNGYFDAQTGGTKYYNANGTSARTWNKTSNTTLYAQWTENTATLTYDANGHGTAPTAVTMKYSQATNAANAITVEGYTFTGWNTKADGTGTPYDAGAVVKAANVIPAATTLYAQWTENTAMLTYDANGHGTAPEAVTMKFTEATNAGAAITGVTGYTFNGWNTAADGKGQSYAAGAEVKAANVEPAVTTLYAQWTENTAMLTYDANGHGTAPEAVTMKFTEATNAGAAITGVTGYTFNGWNTAADGKGQSYAAGAEVKAANVEPAVTTLYAQWTPKTYTVTLNNGSAVSSTDLTATYDAVLPTVTVPVWEKHVFLGYFTAENGQGEKYIDADGTGKVTWLNDSNGVTLYAYWKDSVSIDGLSLLLDGDIGLWFHVTVNDKALLEKGCYMEMSIGGKSGRTETVDLTDTETVDLTDKTPKDESGRYLFAFDVNSIQLAEKVTATFYDANGTVYDTKSQSVEDYYKLIKDQSTNENEKALVKALVNYGYYAQQALSKTNGWVIGKDYATSTKQDGDLITGNLDAYKPVITGSSTHVTGLNVSLLLDNKTTLCLYFTTSDKEMPRVTIDGGSELTPIVYGEQDPTITDGKVTNIEQMSDGRWLVRISNIDALHLGDVHTVTADGRTIYLSALSYGSVIGGTENINAIRALADYYQAALTYAGKTVMTEATVENTAYTYTGHAITPTVTVKAGETPLTEAQYTVTWSGNLTDAGTYTGVITSNDDRILGSLKVTFTIAPKMIDVPTAVSGLVYDHTGKTGVIDGEGYWLMNNVETLAGSFNAVATLNANYCWSDGTTAPKTIPWSIAKQEIAVPEPFTDLIYNGENQLCVHDAPDCTLTGVYQATNAGEYTMTATLKDTANTCWADGTTDAKSITWSIAKATPTANGEISITYYTNGGSFTVTGGQMSVDGTFSFETAPTANGTATATFTPNDSTNYETVNTDAKVTVITTPVTTAVKIGG